MAAMHLSRRQLISVLAGDSSKTLYTFWVTHPEKVSLSLSNPAVFTNKILELLVWPHTDQEPQPQNATTIFFPVVLIHFMWTRRTRLLLVVATRYKSSQLASCGRNRWLIRRRHVRHPIPPFDLINPFESKATHVRDRI